MKKILIRSLFIFIAGLSLYHFFTMGRFYMYPIPTNFSFTIVIFIFASLLFWLGNRTNHKTDKFLQIFLVVVIFANATQFYIRRNIPFGNPNIKITNEQQIKNYLQVELQKLEIFQQQLTMRLNTITDFLNAIDKLQEREKRPEANDPLLKEIDSLKQKLSDTKIKNISGDEPSFQEVKYLQEKLKEVENLKKEVEQELKTT